MAKIVNKYPVGIQTFEKLREKGYLYVDKTQYIVDFREKQMLYDLSESSKTIRKSLFALLFKLISRVEGTLRGIGNS